MDGHFEDIIHFLTTGTALEGYTVQQKKELVVRAINFFVIVGHLYKMGLMKYYDDMYRSLKGEVSSRTLMGVLWEGIMQEEQPRRRFYV